MIYFLALYTIFVFFLTKDILNPAVVVPLLWTIILSIYLNIDVGMQKLNEYTIFIVCIWSIFFSISCFFSYYSKINNTFLIKFLPNTVLIKLLYPFVMGVNILFILLVFLLMGSGFSLHSLVVIRRNFIDDIPPIIKLLYSFNGFSLCYFFTCFYYKNIISKRKLKLLAFILFITSILKMTKTVFFTLFFAFVVILMKKKILNFFKLIFLSIVFLILIIVLALIRGDSGALTDFTIAKYFAWYLFAPLEGFNAIVQGDIVTSSRTFGGHVFRFFYEVLTRIFKIKFPDTGFFGPWTTISFPNNVYTVFAPYYIDFGIIGIMFFSSVIGYVWGKLYNTASRKKSAIAIIFFALFFYSLIMQFFSDYNFYYISTFIQYFLSLWLLFTNNKWCYLVFTKNKQEI